MTGFSENYYRASIRKGFSGYDVVFVHMRNSHGSLCGIIAALLATGCSHTIGYKLTQNDKWVGPARNQTVRVDTFNIGTVPKEDEVLVDQKVCRANSCDGYAKQVGESVSDMLAKHLDHSRLFTKVVRSPSERADLVLSGTISNYTALGTINDTAEAIRLSSSTMGLVGALVGSLSTAGMKTEITSRVDLNPVILSDANGRILWQGSVGARTNFTAHFAQASKGAIYRHPDELLRRAVNELIRDLGQAVSARKD